jgi:uncharacterized protein (DUF1810 family)
LADPFGLERFLAAQASAWPSALAELQAGHKQSHWMWFIFPQLAGLGHSPTARHFALASLDEARAFRAHPVLGARLQQATHAMLAHDGKPVAAILGTPDDLKFHAAMTLFDLAADGEGPFGAALAAFFDGAPHQATLKLLGLPLQINPASGLDGSA